MNNTFSISRFGRYFKYDFKRWVSTYGPTLLLMSAAPLILYTLTVVYSFSAVCRGVGDAGRNYQDPYRLHGDFRYDTDLSIKCLRLCYREARGQYVRPDAGFCLRKVLVNDFEHRGSGSSGIRACLSFD